MNSAAAAASSRASEVGDLKAPKRRGGSSEAAGSGSEDGGEGALGAVAEALSEAAAVPPAAAPRLRPEDSIFVYSEERSWEWEWYIRQSRLHTHDVCRCARGGHRDADGSEPAATTAKAPSLAAGARPGGAPVACGWWRLSPRLFELEPCQVSVALFAQVASLHAVAAQRQGLAAAANESRLRLTQCLFTESRGAAAGSFRCHTLELRFAAPRPKRSKQPWVAFADPRLVRRDEVVLLLGLPLRFPADAKVRVHCMQNRGRLPPHLVALPSAADAAHNALPGALLPLVWLAEAWPARYSLADFTNDLLQRIEASAAESDPLCGLLPVPPYRLNTEAADAILERNGTSILFFRTNRLNILVSGSALIFLLTMHFMPLRLLW